MTKRDWNYWYDCQLKNGPALVPLPDPDGSVSAMMAYAEQHRVSDPLFAEILDASAAGLVAYMYAVDLRRE